MKQLYFILLCISPGFLAAQITTLTFEEFDLEQDTFIEPTTIETPLLSSPFVLPSVSTEFEGYGTFWTNGWTVSTKVDSVTSGLGNQYSAKPASGADSSQTFGMFFVQGIVKLEGGSFIPQEVQVANSTFAHNTIRDGDLDFGFSKKFGGESGDDPDFFKVIVQKYLGDSLYLDSIEFFLADYRFEDNSMDYIVNTWETIDLSALGTCDSLLFTLDSSDKDQFGLLTPAYMCMDNLVVEQVATNVVELSAIPLQAFPNPTSGPLHVQIPEKGMLTVWNTMGQLVYSREVFPGNTTVSLDDQNPGLYVLRWSDGKRARVSKIQVR